MKTIEHDHAMKANDTHVLSQVQTSLFSLLRQARDRHRFLRTISSSDTGLRDDCTGKTGAGNSMSWRSQCQRRIVSLPLECAWNPVMWNKQMETGALYSKIVSILLGSVMLQVNMKAQMDSQMNWVLGIAQSPAPCTPPPSRAWSASSQNEDSSVTFEVDEENRP